MDPPVSVKVVLEAGEGKSQADGNYQIENEPHQT